MDIYHFHQVTGELLGSGAADESPLEPGVFLIPANATKVAPPTQVQGFARVFVNGTWTQVEDHRGETWFQAYASPVTIEELGDPAASGLFVNEPAAPPAPPRIIAGAYFRSALKSMGEYDRVIAALTDPIDLELFSTATVFNESAPDVNTVATALEINLAAVFDSAEAIRSARQS